MKKLAALGFAIAMLSAPVLADRATMSALPGHSMTVTNWYKQNVYDAADTKSLPAVRRLAITAIVDAGRRRSAMARGAGFGAGR